MSNQVRAALTVAYCDITIEYLEDENKFRFELRGRERKAESLKQAKEWIDKPEPAKKSSKKFERFNVTYSGGYSGGAHKKSRCVVTVTSASEDRYREDKSDPSAAWVLRQNGSREKLGVHWLYPINPTSTVLWEKYDALIEEKERIDAEATKVLKSIPTLNLKPCLLTEESV